MRKKRNEGQVEKALLKRALGFEISESKEEYELKDGELVLIKKKVSKRAYPPEVGALKLLLAKSNEESNRRLSDEELKKEKERLLKELREMQE